MNFISVEELTKVYGTKVLFDKISFGINQGQKVGLIAKNGAGKTTLLNILMGKEIADAGNITQRKGITISYLNQSPLFNEESTVEQAIYHSDNAVLNAVRIYETCLAKYEKDGSEESLDAFQNASAQMDQLQAWNYEAKINEVLSKLNISFLDKPIKSLSGGQKKRVALAQILIDEPDFVILDEPTNHLDVEMIEWLEGYLGSSSITILMVTHDRYFLDRVCDEILELDNGSLYRYKGDFQYYVEKKAEREQIENSEIDKAKNLYRRELEWVRKMPRARGTKAKSRVDAFDDVEEKAFSKRKQDTLHLDVKMSRLGGKILELIKLSKRYGDTNILNPFSYVFKRQEKIGIVGKNGVGKTTFLNMIMDLEKPDGGKIQPGETIVFGYYTQAGMNLKEEKRVIEVVKDVAEFIPLSDGSKITASQLLQRFMFNPDVQYTYVSKLSGGEKRRLYLLTILMKNPNFLILDEPTNDLDLITLSILEEFLLHFQGCILLVTHDRYFMDKLSDHLFVFEGDGVIRDFPGNYTQYREKVQEESKQPLVKEKAAEIKKEATEATSVEKRKATYKEKLEYEKLEKEIALLEKEKSELTEKLNSGGDHEEVAKWANRVGEIITLVDEKTIRWLEIAEWM